jgi:hypothetical protein
MAPPNGIEGVNQEAHRFCCRLIFGSNSISTPQLSRPLWHATSTLSLILFPLCVADRACLSHLIGKGGNDPNKTTEKDPAWASSYIFPLRSNHRKIQIEGNPKPKCHIFFHNSSVLSIFTFSLSDVSVKTFGCPTLIK